MEACGTLGEASVREVMDALNADGGQAARVHDVHDDPRPPAHARACSTAGARARPTSTARCTRATSTPTCARRPRSRPSSTPSATSRSATSRARWPSSTPSAAARSSASHVSADADRADSWRLYRLQLALGAAGLAARRARAGAAALGARRARRGAPPRRRRASASPTRRSTPPPRVLLALRRARRRRAVVTVRAAWRQVRAHRRLMRALPVAGAAARRIRRSRHRRRGAAGVLRRLAAPARLRVHRRRSSGSRTSELRAVLAHEQHHRALRDPLRLAVGRVLCQALFFLPVLRPLHDRYGDVAELTADAAALDATDGATAPLASAMLAFGTTQRGRAWSASRPSASTRCSVGRARGGCPGCCCRRARDARRARRARLAGQRQRLGPSDAQPPDRLLAALRARAGARARPRLPGRGLARRGAGDRALRSRERGCHDAYACSITVV